MSDDKKDIDLALLTRNYGGGEIGTQKGFDFLVDKKLDHMASIFKIFRCIAEYRHDFSEKTGICQGCIQDRDYIFFTHQVECQPFFSDGSDTEDDEDDY